MAALGLELGTVSAAWRRSYSMRRCWTSAALSFNSPPGLQSCWASTGLRTKPCTSQAASARASKWPISTWRITLGGEMEATRWRKGEEGWWAGEETFQVTMTRKQGNKTQTELGGTRIFFSSESRDGFPGKPDTLRLRKSGRRSESDSSLFQRYSPTSNRLSLLFSLKLKPLI